MFEDTISLYQNQRQRLLKEYPFRVCFKGENGLDVGGVARDMFSAFYEAAYECFFDGSSQLRPAVFPEMDKSSLSTFGFVLSHAYLMSGILPTKIVFPCLAQCLLGLSVVLSDSIVMEAFVDSISIHESGIVKIAMVEVENKLSVFSPEVSSGLISLFGRFDSRKAPTPSNFKQMLINLARYDFFIKPSAALSFISQGVPEQHHSFWSGMGVDGLFALYRAQSVSTAMVLKMLDEAEGSNPSQERVLVYLRQFIGNMGLDDLRVFLRFVTGSSVCSCMKISIGFNTLTGTLRRPIAHTCAPSLILSSTYPNYQEFASEFRTFFASEHIWTMDGL